MRANANYPIDIGLLKKYSVPGPRYTSYPTAPVFSDAYPSGDFLAEIRSTNEARPNDPISVYVHLPFCDTLCYFCGCTVKITHDPGQITAYDGYLKREIDMIARIVAPSRSVAQLHWGGGTPSYLSPGDIRDVGDHLRSRFTYAKDIEAGVEIDPRGLTRDRMVALREVGFNRVSMGVQDFDPRVQAAVNRIQPESITRDAVEWSREMGFTSLNIDLIYGLPHQSVRSFGPTVDRIIDISPDRIAVFNYAHVPWLKHHQTVIDESTLPAPEEKLAIFLMTMEKLLDAGYVNIGMDHFAKPTDEIAGAQRSGTMYRNFQGYSTKAGCDLYGFGMSAISQVGRVYHQNRKVLGEYFRSIDAGVLPTAAGYRMSDDDLIRREVIMRLMCDTVLVKSRIEERFGIGFDDYFGDALRKLRPLADDGIVSLFADRLEISPPGRLVVRNIAMCFDPYLDKLAKDRPIFSQTV